MEEQEIILEVENEKEQEISILEEEIKEIHPDYEQITITPSTEEQIREGIFDKVTVEAIESEEITIVPTKDNQTKQGLFNKVIVVGDSNLIAENIVQGKTIFGVDGSAAVVDFKITECNSLFAANRRLNILEKLLKICDATNTSYMFSTCLNLTELDLSNFDTSKVTDMDSMFYQCSNLTELDLSNFNTSKVTNMNSMFYFCSSLTELDLSSFDASRVKVVSSMFHQCNKLNTLKSFYNLGKGYTEKRANYSNYTLTLSTTVLSYESLIDVIDKLYNLNLTYKVGNGGRLYSQKLTLGSTHLAKLTAEEIAIATNKRLDGKLIMHCINIQNMI